MYDSNETHNALINLGGMSCRGRFGETILFYLFFLAQTKMSWRSLLTSQYSR